MAVEIVLEPWHEINMVGMSSRGLLGLLSGRHAQLLHVCHTWQTFFFLRYHLFWDSSCLRPQCLSKFHLNRSSKRNMPSGSK